ncbi:MAG: DUF512 domain-containing protein [Lachnospiraceae bacterium]|nr:DUF512 domain-containing protein [Lachnospiraceae bacterium]
MKKKGHLIKEIAVGSIAEELELEPGDRLVSINGEAVEDIFDYQYLVEDEYLDLVVEKANGEEWELEIEKDEDEDLGLIFENGLMDEYRSCTNNCVFCFIDQMPPGMRDTLYFKDDDSRLSFLQGNYITLTNMKQKDIDRIIRFNWSPINISVQTMNPELRCRMLNNRFAGKVLAYLDQLYEAGITMNGQIVLCPGLNDGAELELTIRELSKYLPYMQSVSVVPVGLTRYRDGLYPLKPFEKEDAVSVLEIIRRWQEKLYLEFGNHFVHASDEIYLMAGEPLPDEDEYDGYPQLENGVGMLRLLMEETESAICCKVDEMRADAGEDMTGELWADGDPDGDEVPEIYSTQNVSIATGLLAAPTMNGLLDEIKEAFPWISGKVYPIENRYFGEMITVSGLLTGQDLLAQLKDKPLGDRLLLPENMLRSGERVFLDDMTVDELESALQVPIVMVKPSGKALVNAVLGLGEEDEDDMFRPYELEDDEL